jgi:hypothetical protein
VRGAEIGNFCNLWVPGGKRWLIDQEVSWPPLTPRYAPLWALRHLLLDVLTLTAWGPSRRATTPLLLGNTDLGKGEVQGFGPDGKVYKTQLIMRIYDGSGTLRYYANGKALPPKIISETEAKTYVRQQIARGTLGTLQLGNQQAFPNQTSVRTSAPQTWQISGKSPDGRVYTGQLMQTNWNTGPSGSKFVFKGDGNSHELPSSITALAQANTYVRQKISAGTWKDKNPDPKIYAIPDGKGKIREFNSGQITVTELREKRVFSDGKWMSGGFVADGVTRYSSNPLQGGTYNAEAQGYYVDGNRQQKQITKPDGTVIKDLDAAKARVKDLIGRGVFMPSKSVAQMSPGEKLDYVLTVALKNATPAVAAELEALFTPENMVKMAVLGGVQFIPGVGLAADIVVGICVGQQAIDVGMKYLGAIYTALNATTKAELDGAGVAIAQATAQLGVGVGSTLVGAGIASRPCKIQFRPTDVNRAA